MKYNLNQYSSGNMGEYAFNKVSCLLETAIY